MKYQQLENLESGWKWEYLNKKNLIGENITAYIDSSEIESAVLQFEQARLDPKKIEGWITIHLNPALTIKLNQAIRAKRKRHFNAEHQHTKKKSIDLEYAVWEKLSDHAKSLDATLSDTIEYLISEATKSEIKHKVNQ